MFTFHGQVLPQNIKESLDNYVKGVPTGDFLRCVLSNDLIGAIGRADSNNINCIGVICCYIYNELPSNCYGSSEKVNQWLANRVNYASIKE